MNIFDFLLLALVGTCIVLAVSVRRKMRNRGGGCCGSCTACHACSKSE